MASVVVNGDTSGAVTLSAPAVAGTVTVTLPAASGTMLTTASTGVVTQAMLSTNVAGNGAAFSAYPNANQTITTSTFTKVTLNAELFDTNSNFDSTTNYRFTPTVSGYYMFSYAISAFNSVTPSRLLSTIYKNGSNYSYGSDLILSGSGVSTGPGTALIYMNGSTDYVELYALITAGTPIVSSNGGSNYTYLSGFLARAA